MTKENSLLGRLEEGKNKNKVILNLIEDLQRRLFRNGDNNGLRGRCQIKFGMTPLFNQPGFTLIELLVVVLIIGILAAVALPQYQKAVWKSRFVQAKTLASALAQAEERYYLANGTYTRNYEELDTDVPAVTNPCYSEGCYAYLRWGYCILNERGTYCGVTKTGYTGTYLGYSIRFNYSDVGARVTCVAGGKSGKPSAGDINYQICKADTNDPSPVSWGDTSYGWDYE